MTRELEQARGGRDLTNKEREMVSRHRCHESRDAAGGHQHPTAEPAPAPAKTDLTATTAQLEQQRSKLTQVAAQQKRLAQVKANRDKTMAMWGTMAGYGAAGMATGAAGLYKINSIASVGLDSMQQMSSVQALTRPEGQRRAGHACVRNRRGIRASTSFTAMDARAGSGILAMSASTRNRLGAAMPDMPTLPKPLAWAGPDRRHRL